MKLYKDIFQKSFAITWKHKFLWWFGLLTLFWSGKGIESEIFFTNVDWLRQSLSPFNPHFWKNWDWSSLTSEVRDIIATTNGQIIFLITLAIFLLLCFFVAVVIMLAQIGLTDAFNYYEQGLEGKKVKYTFSAAMAKGSKHWPQVLGVNVLGRAFSFGLLAVVAIPFFTMSGSIPKFFSAIFLFFVLTPISIGIALLTKYAVNFIVIKELSLGKAIAASWRLFVLNFGISVEMAIIMAIAYVLTNVLAISSAFILTLPVFLMVLMGFFGFESVVGVYLYIYLLVLVIFYAVIFSTVFFAAWHWGNWTLLFLELTKGKKPSRIQKFWSGESVKGKRLSVKKNGKKNIKNKARANFPARNK